MNELVVLEMNRQDRATWSLLNRSSALTISKIGQLQSQMTRKLETEPKFHPR